MGAALFGLVTGAIVGDQVLRLTAPAREIPPILGSVDTEDLTPEIDEASMDPDRLAEPIPRRAPSADAMSVSVLAPSAAPGVAAAATATPEI